MATFFNRSLKVSGSVFGESSFAIFTELPISFHFCNNYALNKTKEPHEESERTHKKDSY